MKIAKKFYGYLKKDTLLLVKRKKYLYLSIGLPLLIALMFLLILNPSGYLIKAGVCNLDGSSLSSQTINQLQGFKITIMPKENCSEILKEDVKNKLYPLGIVIPKGFSKNIQNLKQAHVIIYYDNTDISFSNLMAWKVDQALNPFKKTILSHINEELKANVKHIEDGMNIIEKIPGSQYFQKNINEINSNLTNVGNITSEFLVNPLWVSSQPIHIDKTAKDIGITFVFPIIALFIILMLSSTSIIYDKKTNYLIRMKSSTNPLVYLLAKITFFVLLTLAQFALILILFILYGANVSISFSGLTNLILFVGVTNTLLGLIIGLISDNEGIAILFSLILSFPLMLLSGIFSPLETMPTFIQKIATILPLTYQINFSKTALLFNSNFSYWWTIPSIIMLGITYFLINKKVK